MKSKNQTRIFFFGDSICFGQGVSIHKGWVTRTASQLSLLSKSQNHEFMVANSSINGNTSRQALERIGYDIQSQKPDIVIIQFGMNDCNVWETDHGLPRVSPKAFEANLEEIISRVFNSGCNQIILNTNHPTARDQQNMSHTDITYQENNHRYNDIIRKVAKGKPGNLTLHDIEPQFLDFTKGSREKLLELLQPDWLHLSEKGHDIYFDSIYPIIKKTVLEDSNLKHLSALNV